MDEKKEDVEPKADQVTVAIITETGKMELGISSEIPDGIVFIFPDGPQALAFTGQASERLLTQMLSVLILCGIVTDSSEEENGEPRKKPTLH